MRYLTLEEVLILHAYQIDKFGGNPNIRDSRLLESALARPHTSLSGNDMFPAVFDKAAVLALGIIQNHPFIDGNKRTGVHAMLVFLELNNVSVTFTDKELVELGKNIAIKALNIADVANLLRKSSQHRS